MASCCKHKGITHSVKAFPVAATYVSSHIWGCFSLSFLWYEPREDRCTSSERGQWKSVKTSIYPSQQKSSVTWTHVRILGYYLQGSCLKQQVAVLHCRHCKGPSHSSFLASLAMEFVVSGKDELQGQGNKCFLVKPCHPPWTLQWPAAAVGSGVFAALLAAFQCEPLVSKEVIKAIAGLHGCLVHHEQPHRSCAVWFSLLCIFLWKSPFLWCSSDFDPHCRSSSWTIVGSILGNCCLFSLLPCLLHQNRAGNRHCLCHCGLWTSQDSPLR